MSQFEVQHKENSTTVVSKTVRTIEALIRPWTHKASLASVLPGSWILMSCFGAYYMHHFVGRSFGLIRKVNSFFNMFVGVGGLELNLKLATESLSALARTEYITYITRLHKHEHLTLIVLQAHFNPKKSLITEHCVFYINNCTNYFSKITLCNLKKKSMQFKVWSLR